MNEILNKLTIINNSWNDYYINKDYFQKQINFTEEVKSNYYGDLNFYLKDTIGLVKEFEQINSDDEYISKIIVLLQVIYSQQDLIDELLYIFKLKKSSKEDKNPNRQIRNELIGHPISRDEHNRFKSSILFNIREKSKDYINYTKYSLLNGLRVESKSYSVSEIIKNHYLFLNKYLDLIIKKINQNKKDYDRKIKAVFDIPIEKQFNYINQIDKNLLSSISSIFIEEFLEYYLLNIRKHKRYLYCLKEYKKSLRQVLYNLPVDNYFSLIEHYDFEQLNKKDEVFSIDYFIKKYKDNELIYNELLHMKENLFNDKEYYASLNYLYNHKVLKKE